MALTLPQLDTCCFYFSLRNGTKFFGILSLVICSMLALSACLELALLSKTPLEDSEHVFVLISIDLAVQVMQATTSVFLLLGAYQEKPQWLTPWLVSTVVSAVSEAYLCTSLFHSVYHHGEGNEIFRVFLTLVMLADDVYGWLVVYNYRKSLSPQRSSAL